MEIKTVSSTEFQNRAGKWLDEAGRGPVVITRHDRPLRVLIDIEEYERLQSRDSRQVFYPHELPDEIKAELAKGWQGDPAVD
jgi:prevent-host-death family protein